MSIRRFRFSGVGVLLLASLVVAASILVGGSVGRGLNAAGGMLWIASLILVSTQLGAERTRLPLAAMAIAITLLLVLFVQPSNLLIAGLGFAVAGVAIGILAGREPLQWSALIPALWLPLHLAVMIGGALLGASGDGEMAIRTDPPPTEALVPFTMVVAALIGGRAGASMRRTWQPRPGCDDQSTGTATTTSGSV